MLIKSVIISHCESANKNSHCILMAAGHIYQKENSNRHTVIIVQILMNIWHSHLLFKLHSDAVAVKATFS